MAVQNLMELTNSPATSGIATLTAVVGGAPGALTAPLTPQLLLASAPGKIFTVDYLGQVFYFLDSSSNIWQWNSTSGASSATKIVTASSLGTTLNRIALSKDGTTLYGTGANNKIMSILTASPYTVSVFAGSGTAAETDGTGAAAAFNNPQGIDISRDGTYLYVMDINTSTNRFYWRKITVPGAVVTTLSAGVQGAYDIITNIKAGRSGRLYYMDTQVYWALDVFGTATSVFTFGNYGEQFCVDTDNPAEVYLYQFNVANNNGQDMRRFQLAAVSSTQLTPVTTLPYSASTGGSVNQCPDMHFRNPAIYVCDVNANLYRIVG